jgi:hypothetical protein
MDITGIQAAGVAILAALGPSVYAYFKKGAFDDVMGVIGNAAPVMTTYIRRRPGGFTTEEKVELADSVIALFEEVERVTGKNIINGPDNDWIEPEETPVPVPAPISPPGGFDPRYHFATESGIGPDGMKIRGLKMNEESFAFITYGMSAEEAQRVRDQVNLAEKAGLRRYEIDTDKGWYAVENGIPFGSGSI